MRSRLMKTALVALVAMSGLAAQCFSITSPLCGGGEREGHQEHVHGDAGDGELRPGLHYEELGDYIDSNFDVSGGGQLVDIIVKTNGAFAGNINNGQVRIGSSSASLQTLATYAGPWTAFNTPQSLIQNNVTMTLNPTGVSNLLSLIQNQQPIVICHGGAFSQAAGSGMTIDVTIYAQVNATP